MGEDACESVPCVFVLGAAVVAWSSLCVVGLLCVLAAMFAKATEASFRSRRGLCSDVSSPCMMRRRRCVHVLTCARPPRSMIGRMHACASDGSCAWSAAVSMPSVCLCVCVCVCVC